MKINMSMFSRVSLVLSAICFVLVLFVPIWGIYLVAPQYPEGLSMQIWASQLTGNIDIINGLNHYIGMREIHADDFVEFKILTYVFILISLFFLFAAIKKGKKWLYFSFFLFALFATAGIYDFWRWEYDYGHHLDPHAAIKVPGMAYQPPLIGYKQLLNFEAYSVPEIGGWLLIGVGFLLTIAIVIEMRLIKKRVVVGLFLLSTISACNSGSSVPLNLDKDACSSCKMMISDGNFGAEVITSKGKCYKFDDLACLFHFINDERLNTQYFYVNEYGQKNKLIDATTAWFVKHESLRSPMGGNIAAFSSKSAADKKATELNAKAVNWKEIKPLNEVTYQN